MNNYIPSFSSDEENTGPSISLSKNFTWTFSGRVVYAMCQWGILMILAKLGSPEMVGQYSLALAITAPVFAFFNLKLDALLATDARNEYPFTDYFRLRLITSSLALTLILCIAFGITNSRMMLLVVLAVGLAKAIESVSEILFGLMQKNERMDYLGQSLMLKGPLTLVCVALLIYSANSLLLGILGMIAVWAVVLTLFDKHNSLKLLTTDEHVKLPWKLSVLRRLAWFAVPLGIQTMLISLTINTPRYLMAVYHGEAMLGYFTAIAYMYVAGSTISASLQKAVSPRLSIYFARNQRRAFSILLLKLLGIGIAMGSVGVLISSLFGKELLSFFFTPEYSEFVSVLIVMMIAAIALWTRAFVIAALLAMRLVWVQAYISGICLLANLIACLVLIPDYGAIGAAWSTLISAWLSLILYGSIVTHKIMVSWASR